MSKDNKRKWEIEYESLKTKNIDEEIKKLEGEINNTKRSLASIKDTKSDEYRANKMQQKDKEKATKLMKKSVAKNVKENAGTRRNMQQQVLSMQQQTTQYVGMGR